VPPLPRFTPEELTGRATSHVAPLEGFPLLLLHREVAGPFLAMRAAAARDGIDLTPVSGFRDFERQRLIWNEKCRGERPLLDRQGGSLAAAQLEPEALVDAILVWSALPGASRHHWGTDLDVIDAAALPPDYRARLIPEEFAPGGPFQRLDRWLSAHAASFGFYRPYAQDRGGVQPEPWHLSHAPVASQALRQLTVDVLREALVDVGLESGEAVAARLPALHARYVLNVDPAPDAALAAAGPADVTPPTRLS
jgi:LAS superfamily LD-carboxypeptidase LdcB